jgi:hypothetical protein
VHHTSWTCGEIPGLLQHYKIDSMGIALFFFAIIDYVLTVFIGHCWADTEPNLSQISVPQGPAPIQASSIVMAYFDKFVKKS